MLATPKAISIIKLSFSRPVIALGRGSQAFLNRATLAEGFITIMKGRFANTSIVFNH